jgi:Trypsin-like peptidase domain
MVLLATSSPSPKTTTSPNIKKNELPTPSTEPSPPEKKPEDVIRIQANLTTVKIIATDEQDPQSILDPINVVGGGSGFVLARHEVKQPNQNGYIYFVLTNNHVIDKKNHQYYVRTHDGLIHRAFDYKGYKNDPTLDIGVLWFHSPIAYSQAVVINSPNYASPLSVFMAGYECDLKISEGKVCPFNLSWTTGIGKLLARPLQYGYRITLTNDTKPGNSGSPIFNDRGQVIGIHGRGKGNLGSQQYQYADGTGSLQEPLALGVPLDRGKLANQIKLQPNLLPKDYPRTYSFAANSLENNLFSSDKIVILIPQTVVNLSKNPTTILSWVIIIFITYLTLSLITKTVTLPFKKYLGNRKNSCHKKSSDDQNLEKKHQDE